MGIPEVLFGKIAMFTWPFELLRLFIASVVAKHPRPLFQGWETLGHACLENSWRSLQLKESPGPFCRIQSPKLQPKGLGDQAEAHPKLQRHPKRRTQPVHLGCPPRPVTEASAAFKLWGKGRRGARSRPRRAFGYLCFFGGRPYSGGFKNRAS